MTRQTIDIEIDDRTVLDALNQLVQRMGDATPAMHEIAGVLKDASMRAFRDEADPVTGSPSSGLSAQTTIPRREAQGKWPGQIFQLHALLRRSVEASPQYGPDFTAIGTNKPHGRTHQFGAKKDEFGRTSRGGPIRFPRARGDRPYAAALDAVKWRVPPRLRN